MINYINEATDWEGMIATTEAERISKQARNNDLAVRIWERAHETARSLIEMNPEERTSATVLTKSYGYLIHNTAWYQWSQQPGSHTLRRELGAIFCVRAGSYSYDVGTRLLQWQSYFRSENYKITQEILAIDNRPHCWCFSEMLLPAMNMQQPVSVWTTILRSSCRMWNISNRRVLVSGARGRVR